MSPEFEIVDYERFRPCLIASARLECLHSGMRWAEGPVYFADGDFLLWSDIPNNRILKWTEGAGVTVFRSPSYNSNGNTRDRQGRLVTCESGSRRLTRTEYDGSVTVLADGFNGKRLNSPNDVVVASDDCIWFTDPDYGILSDYTGTRAEGELGGCFVFRFDPRSGALDPMITTMRKPNGLAFSPDESILYVADTSVSHHRDGFHHIMAWDVGKGGACTNPRVFVDVNPGVSDGFRVDEEGNVWTSAGDGVHCYAPDGALLGKIRTPEVATNLVFGGPKRNRLFITCASSVYAVYVGAKGAQRP